MLHNRIPVAGQSRELSRSCVAVFSSTVAVASYVRGLGATATSLSSDGGVFIARTTVAVWARLHVVGSMVGHGYRVSSDTITGQLGSSTDPRGRGIGDPAKEQDTAAVPPEHLRAGKEAARFAGARLQENPAGGRPVSGLQLLVGVSDVGELSKVRPRGVNTQRTGVTLAALPRATAEPGCIGVAVAAERIDRVAWPPRHSNAVTVAARGAGPETRCPNCVEVYIVVGPRTDSKVDRLFHPTR